MSDSSTARQTECVSDLTSASALAARLMGPAVVVPGDRMRFSFELIEHLLMVRDRLDRFDMITLRVATIEIETDGTKTVVLAVD